MHLHLDPLGGMAGDMFAAALLDAWPELFEPLDAVLRHSTLGKALAVAHRAHHDGTLAGSRFAVTPGTGAHSHRTYTDVCTLLDDAGLPAPVLGRALAIFRLLGEAEAEVHGVALADVHFHEVGAWDSIADVVSAAWLVEALGEKSATPPTWSCAPLPLGRGRVHGAHGELAAPAPATALLLRGFIVHDDGRDGERVTPTGAAILRHLQPAASPLPLPMRLTQQGNGFGTRTLPGISNVLRVLAFEAPAPPLHAETLGQLSFEVDDQSPEDLAVALDRLRAHAGVLDAIQVPVHGKKGRLGVQVQLLCEAHATSEVIAACFDETTTLGLRCQDVRRLSLARETYQADAGVLRLRVKQARRPGGELTRKVEMDDLAQLDGGRAARERVRRDLETGRRAGAGEIDDA